MRNAIANNANIKVTADIDLSNSTLEIPSNKTVTINLNGHKLDRKLTKRGESRGQVITVRSGATLNLSNGTLKGGWGGDSGGLVNEGGTVNLTNVTITGGTVIAKAGRNETGCRAIGPGEDSDNYGKLTIGDEMMVSSERNAAASERKNIRTRRW